MRGEPLESDFGIPAECQKRQAGCLPSEHATRSSTKVRVEAGPVEGPEDATQVGAIGDARQGHDEDELEQGSPEHSRRGSVQARTGHCGNRKTAVSADAYDRRRIQIEGVIVTLRA